MRLENYVGQERVKRLIKPEIAAARSKGIMRNVLLEGGFGAGKTALSECIAAELGYEPIKFPNAKGLTPKVVREMLYALGTRKDHGYDSRGRPGPNAKRYLIIVDEAHTMPDAEVWYEPMADYQVTIAGAVSWIPYITLVLATNYPQMLPGAFLRRLLRYRLESYTTAELAKIVLVNLPRVTPEIATAAAERCRGVAGIAVELAISADNYGSIEYFDAAGIDECGLTDMDRDYLAAMQSYPNAVSIATMAARLQCDAETLRKTVEPWLVSLGLIEITDKGRKLTAPGRGARPASEMVAHAIRGKSAGVTLGAGKAPK